MYVVITEHLKESESFWGIIAVVCYSTDLQGFVFQVKFGVGFRCTLVLWATLITLATRKCYQMEIKNVFRLTNS